MEILRITHTANIHLLLAPFTATIRVFGLNCLDSSTLKKSPKWHYYSCFILGLFLLQATYHLVMFYNNNFSQTEREHRDFCILVSELLSTLTGVFAILPNILENDQKAEVLRKLTLVNDYWYQMDGTTVIYSRRRYFSDVFVFAIFVTGMAITDSVSFVIGDYLNFMPIVVPELIARILSWTETYYFLIILRIVNDHLVRVQSQLLRLGTGRSAQTVDRLRALATIHRTLRRICKVLNRVYGAVIVSITLYLIVDLIGYYYVMVEGLAPLIDSEKDFTGLFCVEYTIDILMSLVAFYVLIRDAVNVTKQEQISIGIVQKLQYESDQEDQSIYLKLFARQIHDDRITFNPCGFFQIDFRLMCEVMGNSIIYVATLLQFYFAEFPHTNRSVNSLQI